MLDFADFALQEQLQDNVMVCFSTTVRYQSEVLSRLIAIAFRGAFAFD